MPKTYSSSPQRKVSIPLSRSKEIKLGKSRSIYTPNCNVRRMEDTSKLRSTLRKLG